MADWNLTKLKCSDAAVIKACASALKNSDRNGCNGWKEGDTELITETKNSFPREKINEICKHFPGAVITCDYGLDADQFSDIVIIKFCAGYDTWVGVKQDYMFNQIPFDNKKDRAAIYNKVVAFCCRLDTIEEDKNGIPSLDWFKEEVCYKFEHDGVDGKKYLIQATKNKDRICFKVFEGLVRYDWCERDLLF